MLRVKRKIMDTNQTIKEDVFTSSEDLESITENDLTFEITGYIQKIYQLKKFGTNNEKAVFQFILCNGKDTIQVISWNELALTMEKSVVDTGMVIHLEKIMPKKPKNLHFLRTSIKLELVVQQCTKLNILGKYNPEKPTETSVKCDLQDILRFSNSLIDVIAYIKTSFAEVKDMKSKTGFYIGAITDGYFKVQVSISNVSLDDLDYLQKGVRVSVSGRVKIVDKRPVTIYVEHSKNIIVVDQARTMPFLKTINGFYKIRPIPK